MTVFDNSFVKDCSKTCFFSFRVISEGVYIIWAFFTDFGELFRVRDGGWIFVLGRLLNFIIMLGCRMVQEGTFDKSGLCLIFKEIDSLISCSIQIPKVIILFSFMVE